jgi:pimeloyl-ACP methyl ester carboxylesterase
MMLDARLYTTQLRDLASNAALQVGNITGADSVGAIARQVLADAPERFALAGLSMGGIVAFELLRQAPDRVTHLALLDTTPYADRPDRQAVRLEQVAQVAQGHLRDVVVNSLKPLYLAACNRGDARLLRPIVEMATELGPEVFRRQSLALRDRPDSTSLLSQIACPTLVLCGREDALCPVAYHELMAAAIPRADLVVLGSCGHLSPMERPDAVTTALWQLLRRSE